MNSAAPCDLHGYGLELPPSTTLADALRAYKGNRKPLSFQPSFFAARAGNGAAPWYQYHEQRDAEATELQKLIRDQAEDQARDARVSIKVNDFERELREALVMMDQRRQIAHAMSKALKVCAPLAAERQAVDLEELTERMLLCRVEGHAGVTDDADESLRFAFAFKCGSTRYCTDCSREHTMYEAERFNVAMMEHINRNPPAALERVERAAKSGDKAALARAVNALEFRAHYLVATRPSVPLGKMDEGCEETFEMFKAFLSFKRKCSNVQRRRHGHGKRKRKIHYWQPGQQFRVDADGDKHYDGPGIHGALVQLECHWTAAGAWHPHLNIIVLTRGRFDYRMARKLWGYNLHCEPVEPTAHGFAAAFVELIKYPFRHVAEKNAAKREAGATEAPPFDAWPLEARVEWHAATRNAVEVEATPRYSSGERVQGTRWLRSYGVLHGIKAPPIEAQEVRWLRPITFTDDGAYFVGSITGSKFSRSVPNSHIALYRVPIPRPPPGTLRR